MAVTSFALHDLGWHAFQQLCHTVLREVLGQTVLAFLDQNDGGRDGAFAGTWNPSPGMTLGGEFVVQCKHTARVGHNLSFSDLDDELKKANALAADGRCHIYVLMTNAGVSGETERRLTRELTSRGVRDVLILGSTWLNQTISENSRLRRLVPRLYGLGDLTQILDERAYRQARAVLDAMRSDLAKLVLTGTYDRAAQAVSEHGFVLLVGAPATGKTTIAAQLALGAADEYGTAVVKLDTIADLQHRWNPDEDQFFWLDDAFGATQFDRSSAQAWNIAVPRIVGALDSGALFVLTTRDYVYEAARSHLKPGSFPLLNESQVVVDVSELTSEERKQILYNHLRHGRQPNEFIDRIHLHLDAISDSDGFTPELARRLSDPLFTKGIDPESAVSIRRFFERPTDFLLDVMRGLDDDGRAALGLIYINQNWLQSPIQLEQRDRDLVDRLGSDLGGVTASLDSLDGSLVENVVREGRTGWTFSHPTMIDAYAELVRRPELLHHFVAGFPLENLLRTISCGEVGIEGAVVIPEPLYENVLDRLDEPCSRRSENFSWWERRLHTSFLTSRCDCSFLKQWLDRDAKRLERLASPGLMLDADPDNELVARLVECGVFPEDYRERFADDLIDYCVMGVDPSLLWNEVLIGILSESEQAELVSRARTELLTSPREAISNCTDGWDSPGDHGSPEDAVEPLRSLVHHVPRIFAADDEVAMLARRFDVALDEWVAEQAWEESGRGSRRKADLGDRSPEVTRTSRSRSVFDDIAEGRIDPA